MLKTIKKVLLGSFSVLGIGLIIWTILLLNPSISYANQTTVGNVTIFHNQELPVGATEIVNNAMEIISDTDIFDDELQLHFCLNDDDIYPDLFPFAGATAYAFFNKTVMYASEPDFEKNFTKFKWKKNNYEIRKYNLTSLLAHEFMHNLQHNHNPKYQILSTVGKINWILEGHAEYYSRQFNNDGLLSEKIEKYLEEDNKDHVGIPVFYYEDGTIQSLSYFKYSLVIQYLMEVKKLSFDEICAFSPDFKETYNEMLHWNSTKN